MSPALGTVLFVLLVAGPVVGLVPWALSGWQLQAPLLGGEPSRWVGVGLFLAGLPLWAAAAVRFVRQGRGTPAPLAPPERLVVTGLYRYVRNPMYIAVLAMIFGQALYLGSRGTIVYGLCLALGFHLFVVLYEEPTLRDRFGEEYVAYCRRVRRWIPRLTPAHPGDPVAAD
ncbi:MAG TPA: isoprenylcysteine carboxylmethyltransferase family protein [Chloroflexota bacterium]|nr:isoprenylcysteine carboxylmethyltransferase family protein [Chloroflexota bacterium]